MSKNSLGRALENTSAAADAFAVRPACAGDCAALYDLYAQLGKNDPGYFETCLAAQERGERVVLIATPAPLGVSPGTNRREPEIIGFAILNQIPRYRPFQKLNIPEIQDLNVVPAARRQGAGTALIRHCEDLARQKGCAQIGIGVGLNATFGAAQRLYVSLGYVPDGQGVSYDRGPVAAGQRRPVDDDLCLMLLKDL